MRAWLMVFAWLIVCRIAYNRAYELTTTSRVATLALCIYETAQVFFFALVG